jgi:hypothetical protein
LRRTVEGQFANIYTNKWQGVARIRQQQHTSSEPVRRARR